MRSSVIINIIRKYIRSQGLQTIYFRVHYRHKEKHMTPKELLQQLRKIFSMQEIADSTGLHFTTLYHIKDGADAKASTMVKLEQLYKANKRRIGRVK